MCQADYCKVVGGSSKLVIPGLITTLSGEGGGVRVGVDEESCQYPLNQV